MRRVPPLHVVTDDEVLADPEFPGRARVVLEAGGHAVALHLRGPHTHGRRLYDLAAMLVPTARASGAIVLVNDRVDVALAAGADGVQLGRRGMLPPDARRVAGPELLVGCSVSTRAEGVEAVAGGADFLLVGNVYPTGSHPGWPGIRLDVVSTMLELEVPVVGIGGITPARVAEVRRAGARGVACIRAVWAARDPGDAVSRFLSAWNDFDA